MDAVPQLTEGACARFHSGDKDDEQLWTSSPIVQLLSIKKVSASQGHDRYRVIISDGVNFIQSMLATQLNSLVEADTITKNTICKLTNMSCNVIQNKRSVILSFYFVLLLKVIRISVTQTRCCVRVERRSKGC